MPLKDGKETNFRVQTTVLRVYKYVDKTSTLHITKKKEYIYIDSSFCTVYLSPCLQQLVRRNLGLKGCVKSNNLIFLIKNLSLIQQ